MLTKEELQKNLQRLHKLRPIDDSFMRCLFRENIPLAQMVLRIILQKEDLVIISLETQADMKRLVGARSICLDAYGTDSLGKKYDIEIQRADSGANVHRARYHASVMDIENLDASQDFEELPDTYTIFITENDVFEKGKAIYLIERFNFGTDELFGDGAHILYVNGAYRGNDDIGRLMHDFSCSDPADMYNHELAKQTRYFKQTTEGVEVMCKAMEEMIQEHVFKATLANLQSVMEEFNVSVQQAMKVLKIPVSDQPLYLEKLEQRKTQ